MTAWLNRNDNETKKSEPNSKTGEKMTSASKLKKCAREKKVFMSHIVNPQMVLLMDIKKGKLMKMTKHRKNETSGHKEEIERECEPELT
jgi:hypothetical protein